MAKTLKVDFHCHTSASPDCLVSPEELVPACLRRNIDRIVITDHNTIEGALIAKSIHPDLVIVGEEIMTTRGELLAVFVTEAVPSGLTPIHAIQRLRDQGAFISVSHPFDWRSGAWNQEDLVEIVPLVDAIETFNARCMKPWANRQAGEFATKYLLPGTAGSDAHSIQEIGRCHVELAPFHDPAELRKRIATGNINRKSSPIWVHLASRYAKISKSR